MKAGATRKGAFRGFNGTWSRIFIEIAGEASGKAIRDNLRSVANPPGVEVTDIVQALDLIRQGEEINYQGASGEITFDDKGDVSGKYATWSIADDGSIEFGEPIDLG